MDLHGFGPQLALGTLMTLKLAFASLAVGLVLGLLGATAKASPRASLRWLGDGYTTLVRGVPELLVVLIVYFGSSAALGMVTGWVGMETHVELDPFTAGTLALGLTFGAYATEVFRGALATVPKGHIEAAHALGLGPWHTFSRIVLPQLWRVALPGLGNLFMVLLKDTALVSVVGLDELMRKSQLAVGFTKQPFTFYAVAAGIYLLLTVVTGGGLMMLERRANRGFARARS